MVDSISDPGEERMVFLSDRDGTLDANARRLHLLDNDLFLLWSVSVMVCEVTVR